MIMKEQPNLEGMPFAAIFSNRKFERITLGELINRGGAAGRIYRVKEFPQYVAKIFHSKSKSATNRQKLESMLLNRPNFPPAVKDGVEYVQIAWPEAILDDENGFCVGYLMPFVNMDEAVSLDHLMQKAIRHKLGLSEKYSYRVFAAYNVAAMVAALHRAGHYIVDLKPSNVSVYKNSMIVAMVDCDGFSIKGEKGNRYPAEFVSEEYIYPEGMELDCEDMGEEQDKFALAVIIFKLLNNGIHPFSGTPRKKDDEMLTIQNRIEQYHYAYGLWPDSYHAPHPYSIHEYFDVKTLELFERAFVRGGKRPSAEEWQKHLHYLLKNLKPCPKNQDHSYFTAKGCGLCVAEERFRGRLQAESQKIHTPQTLRGMEISALSVESMEKDRAKKRHDAIKIQRITLAGIALYFIFFGLLFQILQPLADMLKNIGFAAQAFIITLVMFAINRFIRTYQKKLPLLKNRGLTQMLQVYAFICLIVALLFFNEIPQDIFLPAL